MLFLNGLKEGSKCSQLQGQSTLKKILKILPITVVRLAIYILNIFLIPIPQSSDNNYEGYLLYPKLFIFLACLAFIEIIAFIGVQILRKNKLESIKNQDLSEREGKPKQERIMHKSATFFWHLIMAINLLMLVFTIWYSTTFAVYYRFKLRFLRFVDDFFEYLTLGYFIINPICYSKTPIYEYCTGQIALFKYFFLALMLGATMDVILFANNVNLYIFISLLILFGCYILSEMRGKIHCWDKFKYVYNSQ